VSSSKTFFIKSYGCQMNVYDSGRMADVLASHGYSPCDAPDAADIIVLNTCHIREKAAEKVYSDVGRLRRRGSAEERPIIAVAGCVAQAEGEEILRRSPHVEIVVGPQSYHRLPGLIEGVRRARERRMARTGQIDTDFPAEPKFDFLPDLGAPVGPAAFLTVQEGCDKFCAFCVVPYTRGAEFSRPAADVMAEARRLVRRGAREITFLGQNVNAYHGAATDGSEWGLGRLVRELAEVDGLARIRYTTSHPLDMDDDLIAAHAEVPALMPYLHLPVQSGSDRVLRLMNRRHGSADYLRTVDAIRRKRPDIALSSDFIVGHPGETDADFAATLDLVRTVGYAQAYSFKYSPRPGTPAAEAAEQVPDAEKAARLAALQDLLNAQQLAFNAAFVGDDVEVLFDRPGARPAQAAGRSRHMQAVHVDCADPPAARRLLGTIAWIKVAKAHPNSLSGAAPDELRRNDGMPQAEITAS
jgi:tRNA-2-methylthio-N6-dimethylallyladenosine synthase